MYTADEKKNAIQKYIDNNYNATKTVRELGYPSVPGLLKWYNAYYQPKSEKTVKPKKERRIYTPEEKQHAIDLYFKNGCNLKKTVRELGYGSQTGVLRWLRDTVPDKVSKPVPREWRVDYSEETKQSAVLELCSNELTPNEVCQKYGISRTTLYEWKIQYIGKGKSALNEDKKTKKSDYIKQIEELQSQKEAVERELSEMNAHKSTRHCEHNMNKAIFLSCFGDFSDFSYFFPGLFRIFESSPNLCVNSSSSYVSSSMLPLSSGDLIEWSLVCHSTLSYQKFCD